MGQEQPPEVIPVLANEATDLLDLVAELFWHLTPGERDQESWLGRDEPDVHAGKLYEELADQIPRVTDSVKAFLTDPNISMADRRRRAYAVLDVVDDLVGTRSHPVRNSRTREGNGPWQQLLQRLYHRGRFNDARARVAVIPASYSASPKPVPRHRIGRRLCFVKPVLGARVSYKYVHGLDWDRQSPWKCAVVPVPTESRQLAHVPVAHLTVPHYWVQHNFTEEDRSSILKAVREISQNVTIPAAVFPEAALDTESVRQVHEEFMSLSASPQRSHEGLQILFLGFWGEPGRVGSRNGVQVIIRRGARGWHQAKINSFDIGNSKITDDKLGLPLLATPQDVYREWLDLSCDPDVVVADTAFGRMLVAICEDAAHLNPSKSVAVDAEVDYVLLPVLERELKRGRWYHQAAQQLVREPGAVTIVATSASLERRNRIEKPGPDDPITVVLVNNHPWRPPRRRAWNPRSKRMWRVVEVPRRTSALGGA